MAALFGLEEAPRASARTFPRECLRDAQGSPGWRIPKPPALPLEGGDREELVRPAPGDEEERVPSLLVVAFGWLTGLACERRAVPGAARNVDPVA